MIDVAVVIPIYGHHDMTKKCIEMTLANAGMDIDILVVDDCSPEPFEYDRKNVTILRLDSNVGFTAANNEGLLHCENDYRFIHMLNNDTEPRPDFIRKLYDVMNADERIGIAASARILKTDTEHNLELFGADLIRGYQRMTSETQDLPKIMHVAWVPLCSAMIRHRMMREIGVLDKRMKTWCSDNAYCIDALFRGWGVVLVPDSRVFHIHQVTTGIKNEDGVRHDQQILLEKLSHHQYADLMNKMPLDCESNVYGKITFETYKKEEAAN